VPARVTGSRSTQIAAGCALLAIAAACSRPSQLGADLVVTRAKVWTGDPQRPIAEAVAVLGDRIAAVGAADEIDRWRGSATTVIDAAGRLVVAGFNDAHVHLVDGGRRLDSVDLTDADSPAELARRIGERAKARPHEWMLGGAWDERRWVRAELPTRHLIDERTNGTPVFVTRYDGRMALANSAALGRAGVTERTADPPGGVIVRDAHGMPTGIFEDAAMDLIARAIPPITSEQRTQAVRRAMRYAASMGVTSVHDMSPGSEDIAAYADLANRGELTVRVYAALPEAGWYDQAKIGMRRAFGSPWVRLGAVHSRLDAATAPDSDRRTRLMAADHAGLQLCMDVRDAREAAAALALVADLIRADGDRDRRVRVEHAQHASAGDVRRFAEQKAIASIDAAVEEAFKRFAVLDSSRVALGSDWPSAPLNPMARLARAAAAASVPAAVAASTSGPAFAEFQEADKGTIARGKLADMVILSDDLFAMPTARIESVRVMTTIAGGRVVHQRNP
jgi:predicted amidohydrolase YtcJ